MFEQKLEELVGHQCSEPESFREYLARTGQDESISTPRYISIDDQKKLHPSLREENVMVFRLGQSDHGTTNFGLARYQNGWSDYFLYDDKCFEDSQPRLFIPEVGFDQLFTYQLLPNLSESALVNLAFACGLMQAALGLDPRDKLPAALSGTFNPTFKFRAFPGAKTWTHREGQVQIDGAILGKRHGKQIMFVVEAKTDKSKTLAKHKLFYPVVGLLTAIPLNIQIVPVYMRVTRKPGQHIFQIAECEVQMPPDGSPPCISDMSVVNTRCWSLGGFRA